MASRSLLPFSIPLLVLLHVATAATTGGGACRKNTTLDGLEVDLSMLQHQLRGVVTILDGCSFAVQDFDMLAGSPQVRWWGSAGDDFQNLMDGSRISDLPLNRTYRNQSLTVRLSDNVTWDGIAVLAVWDPTTASDFGHAMLRNATDDEAGFPSLPPPPPPSSDLSPAPSPWPSSGIKPGSKKPIRRQPTMFDNCRTLSPRYRVRWTLYPESDSIDIGLEATVPWEYYMAFGWAAPGSSSPMLNADVTIAGFTEDGSPFSEDYYITEYSECLIDKDGKAQGVCPDTIYEGSDPVGMVNNTKLVYGHRRDGVAFIRYTRPLVSEDKKYDVPVNGTGEMTVVWALGQIRPPDALRPYYLPQNHGNPQDTAYGYLTVNVSETVNDCLGALDAEDKGDQDLVIADGKTVLVVISAPALRYPNPPNPSNVLYINKKEAPLLRVERGVPVTFSIQAGHDMALYITSSPIGGNVTSQNLSEVVYAGGSMFGGVPSSPKELKWLPDRNTPDQVYYQSLFQQKMGWKIQVVDGGLSDMYNSSVMLDDQQVNFFWTLTEDSISIAARGTKKSGYIAIGFGSGMINSYAYVGWIDVEGKGHVNSYWIDGKDALSVHLTSENLTHVRCRQENGIITFEFTRPLSPSCSGGKECKNIVDPTTPLKVIWAMGAQWSEDNLSENNMHSLTSSKPTRVLLLQGSAEAEQDLWPVLAVHGFMMFVSWGILLPGGILAARYLKHIQGDIWYRTHVYLQYSGIAIMLLGVLFAVAELRGFYVSSIHVKFGVAAISLAFAQPINAYVRPKKSSRGETDSTKRKIWEYFHFIVGRSAIVAGVAALFSGMKHLGHRNGNENIQGLTWALILWLLVGALLVMYLEYMEVKRRRTYRNFTPGNWVLGNSEEDDSADLLHPDRIVTNPDSHSVGIMEVQLEPLSR